MTANRDGADEVHQALLAGIARLGIAAMDTHPLAGDASTRRFFRLRLDRGGSLVAAVYPSGDEMQAERHAAAQTWARSVGLPVPKLVAAAGRVVVSDDLGDEDLETALRQGRSGVLEAVRANLVAFQGVAWEDAPNACFDAAFFRRELEGFEHYFAADLRAQDVDTPAFLDALARALAGHPYRLAHRDFHLNNLFLHSGRVWAVDFQDLRGGPDTYDAASLLYERAAPELIADPAGWAEAAAVACGWKGSWRRRLLECRAQRGLKVLGTFARLTRARGVRTYAVWLPIVREQTAAALRQLSPPASLMRLLESAHPAERL